MEKQITLSVPMGKFLQYPCPTLDNLLLSFFGGANRCKSSKCSSLVNKTESNLSNLGSRDGSRRCWVAGKLKALDASMSGSTLLGCISLSPTRRLNPRLVDLTGLWMGGSLKILNPAVAWELFLISVALSCNSNNLRLYSSFRLAFLCISIICLCLSLWALDSLLYNWMIEMSFEDCLSSFHWRWTSHGWSTLNLLLGIINCCKVCRIDFDCTVSLNSIKPNIETKLKWLHPSYQNPQWSPIRYQNEARYIPK